MAVVLRIVGVPRSTYYYRVNQHNTQRKVSGGRPIPGYSYTKQQSIVSDDQIKKWLLQFIENEGFAYGYVKLTVALRKTYGLVINKKKVYRLCKELKILRPQRKKKVNVPKRLAKNRIVTNSNQLWETDLKYGFIAGEQRFFFVLSYIDVYDREIVGYHIGLRCEGKDAARTLQQALWKRKLLNNANKPVIRTDNGPQYTCYTFQEECKKLEIEHERIPCRTPNKNAHIEAFHSILEEECLGHHEFRTYAEAYRAVSEFMYHYNNKRIHSGVRYMTPTEFYEKNRRHECTPLKEIKL
nr:IS3 family transposase [Desulforamulus ferrireducens]